MNAWAFFGCGAPLGMHSVSELSWLPSLGMTKSISSSSVMIWAMSPLYSSTRSTSPDSSRSCPLSSWKVLMMGFCLIIIAVDLVDDLGVCRALTEWPRYLAHRRNMSPASESRAMRSLYSVLNRTDTFQLSGTALHLRLAIADAERQPGVGHRIFAARIVGDIDEGRIDILHVRDLRVIERDDACPTGPCVPRSRSTVRSRR